MLEIIALLECYNTYDQTDIYFDVARSILENYNSMDTSSLKAFAESIHVSTSTANRFVRQLYYENFSQYRQYHDQTLDQYQYDGRYFPSLEEGAVSLAAYGDMLSQHIQKSMTVDAENRLRQLVERILDSREIVFIGIPVHSEVWRLQVELVLLGKQTSAFIDPNYQHQAVEKVGKDSLVISLVYTRQEDSHNFQLLQLAKERGAKTGGISHIPQEGKGLDWSLSYERTGSQMDSMILQGFLNYTGSLLRNHYLANRAMPTL